MFAKEELETLKWMILIAEEKLAELEQKATAKEYKQNLEKITQKILKNQ